MVRGGAKLADGYEAEADGSARGFNRHIHRVDTTLRFSGSVNWADRQRYSPATKFRTRLTYLKRGPRMRKTVCRGLFFPMLLVVLACGGGGGGGPTAPPAPVYPAAGGAWSGTWLATASLPLTSRLDLLQGASGQITGTFSTLNNTLDIAGTVSPDLSFAWHAIGNAGGCTQLNGTGHFNSTAPTQMSGTIDLDGSGCVPATSRFFGPVTMTKIGAAASGARKTTPAGLIDDVLRLMAN
jgi:hypothetical protein